MRVLATMLCWVLVFSGSPLRAEPARGSDPTGLGAAGPAAPSHLDRPWLRSPSGVRLVTDVGDPASDVDVRIAELTAQREGINNGWPRAGVISGGILLGAGFLAMGVALDDDMPHRPNWWAAGGALAGAGLILVGTGVAFLVKQHRKRNAIHRQILDLQRSRQARSSPAWRLSLAGMTVAGMPKGLPASGAD